MTGKTAFIEKMVVDSENQILILDFDTQFSSLKVNGCLSPIFYQTNGPEIFLPYIALPFEIIDKIVDSLILNKTIILDSLNGLIDYFASVLKRSKKNFSIAETSDINKDEIKGNYRRNSTGHLALFLLKVLFTNPLANGVSIITTSYVSQKSMEGLRSKLINLESDSFFYDTHFERLSHSVAFLRYDCERDLLFYTRILNPKKVAHNDINLDYPKSFQIK